MGGKRGASEKKKSQGSASLLHGSGESVRKLARKAQTGPEGDGPTLSLGSATQGSSHTAVGLMGERHRNYRWWGPGLAEDRKADPVIHSTKIGWSSGVGKEKRQGRPEYESSTAT